MEEFEKKHENNGLAFPPRLLGEEIHQGDLELSSPGSQTKIHTGT